MGTKRKYSRAEADFIRAAALAAMPSLQVEACNWRLHQNRKHDMPRISRSGTYLHVAIDSVQQAEALLGQLKKCLGPIQDDSEL